jgi:peptidoglycan/LPS O-acetylase OafA/YrhL
MKAKGGCNGTPARDGKSLRSCTGVSMSDRLLKLLLWAGVVYFCCMAVAHFFGIKVPILFIYYDTPYYAYQDKIISFAVVAYICLFVSAARSRDAVVPALIAIWVTVLGLCAVNLSDALQSVLSGKSTLIYWLQTAALAVYAVCLTLFWQQSRQGVTR